MKKISYSVAVNTTLGIETSFGHTLGGNIAYDQLMAHKDIDVYVYFMGQHFEVIIPYHAIAYAVIERASEDVQAPSDSICGGGGELKVSIPSDVTDYVAFDNVSGNCRLYLDPLYGIESIEYNGQSISVDQFRQAMIDGKASLRVEGWEWDEDEGNMMAVSCDEVSWEMTVNLIFTYMDASTTEEASFNFSRNV